MCKIFCTNSILCTCVSLINKRSKHSSQPVRVTCAERSSSFSAFSQTTYASCLIQTWPPVVQRQICHMTFSDQSAISVHHDTAHAQSSTIARPCRPEHPDARHKCEVCGRKFTKKSSLSLHLRTVHSTDGPRYECDIY